MRFTSNKNSTDLQSWELEFGGCWLFDGGLVVAGVGEGQPEPAAPAGKQVEQVPTEVLL